MKATPDTLSAFVFQRPHVRQAHEIGDFQLFGARLRVDAGGAHGVLVADVAQRVAQGLAALAEGGADDVGEALAVVDADQRSEEHTSELQSLMRISYAVFCLKKKTTTSKTNEVIRM